jgi:hypothetical protein
MRVLTATALVCGALGAAGCADEAAKEAPGTLPPSGTAYRALGDDERVAVAARCRDRAAAASGGVAASQLGDVDLQALRARLDVAFRYVDDQPRAVAEVCAKQLPFATPGLRVSFDGARDSGDAFTYETDSDKPLTIRGEVTPDPRGGHVAARREFGSSEAHRATIGPDGHFALPTVRLRKVANNSFVLDIDAPPSALRKVHFSAICLDCLAGGPPPTR